MYILAYKGISLMSRLIRWQTRSEYSHIAVELDDGSMVEAWQGDGVIWRKDFKDGHSSGTKVDVYQFRNELRHPEAAKKYLEMHIGDRYDWRNVIRFIPRFRPRPNDLWFCSELACGAARAGGIILQRLPCDTLSPRDVAMSPELEWITERIV